MVVKMVVAHHNILLPPRKDSEEIDVGGTTQFVYESSNARLFIRENFTREEVSEGYSVVISVDRQGSGRDDDYHLTEKIPNYDEALEQYTKIRELLGEGARVIITHATILGEGKARVESLEGKVESS